MFRSKSEEELTISRQMEDIWRNSPRHLPGLMIQYFFDHIDTEQREAAASLLEIKLRQRFTAADITPLLRVQILEFSKASKGRYFNNHCNLTIRGYLKDPTLLDEDHSKGKNGFYWRWISALGWLNNSSAISLLELALNSKDKTASVYAAESLAQCGSRAGEQILLEGTTFCSNSGRFRRAIFALARLENPEGINRVITHFCWQSVSGILGVDLPCWIERNVNQFEQNVNTNQSDWGDVYGQLLFERRQKIERSPAS